MKGGGWGKWFGGDSLPSTLKGLGSILSTVKQENQVDPRDTGTTVYPGHKHGHLLLIM
jgi:hypothetical protein